jgi:hypothetical protein
LRNVWTGNNHIKGGSERCLYGARESERERERERETDRQTERERERERERDERESERGTSSAMMSFSVLSVLRRFLTSSAPKARSF